MKEETKKNIFAILAIIAKLICKIFTIFICIIIFMFNFLCACAKGK